MCYPPLQWQTYDIDYTTARFDSSGKKSAEARITVKHNGVVIQDNVVLKGGTPGAWRRRLRTAGRSTFRTTATR